MSLASKISEREGKLIRSIKAEDLSTIVLGEYFLILNQLLWLL